MLKEDKVKVRKRDSSVQPVMHISSLHFPQAIKRSSDDGSDADRPALALPPRSPGEVPPAAPPQDDKGGGRKLLLSFIGIFVGLAVAVAAIFIIFKIHNNAAQAPVPSPEPAPAAGTASPEPQPSETSAPASGFDDTAAFVPNGRDGLIPINYCLPDQPDGAPLVVMCHGFRGDRTGNGHFAPLAQELAAAGIASVRLDFPGHGDNTESSTAYTLHNIASDITAVIRWMEDKHVDTANIAMVGHSMGGRIVTQYIQPDDGPDAVNDYCSSVKGIALWSPADGDGLQSLEFLDIENFDNVRSFREAARAGSTFLIPKWDIELSDVLFTEVENSHPYDILRSYPGRILLFYTTNENVVFSEDTVNSVIQAVTDNPNGEVIPPQEFSDAHHNYTALDPDLGPDLNPILDQKLRDYTMNRLLLPVLKGEPLPEATAAPSPDPQAPAVPEENAPADNGAGMEDTAAPSPDAAAGTEPAPGDPQTEALDPSAGNGGTPDPWSAPAA